MKTHQTPPEPNFGQTPGAAGSKLPGGRAEEIRPKTAGSRHWQLFAIGQAAGWSQVAVMFTAAAVSRGQSATQVLWVVTANIVVGVVVSTMLAIMLGRLHWGRLSTAKLLPLCLVALILATVAHLIVVSVSSVAGQGAWSFAGFAGPTVGGVFRPLILYSLWLAGLLLARLFVERRTARLQMARMQQEIRDSELELLQSQLDPHFLFNALTLLQAEADDSERVRELTLRLSLYLRAAIGSGQAVVAVGQQVEACRAYLELQRARFGDRLSWRLSIDDEVLPVPLPSLTLQTLLEHAVRYGLEADGNETEIILSARLLTERLVIDVSNPGTLAAPGGTASAGGTTARKWRPSGLPNLTRRLELAYGPRARLEQWSEAGLVHTTIQVTMNQSPAGDPAR